MVFLPDHYINRVVVVAVLLFEKDEEVDVVPVVVLVFLVVGERALPFLELDFFLSADEADFLLEVGFLLVVLTEFCKCVDDDAKDHVH